MLYSYAQNKAILYSYTQTKPYYTVTPKQSHTVTPKQSHTILLRPNKAIQLHPNKAILYSYAQTKPYSYTQTKLCYTATPNQSYVIQLHPNKVMLYSYAHTKKPCFKASLKIAILNSYALIKPYILQLRRINTCFKFSWTEKNLFLQLRHVIHMYGLYKLGIYCQCIECDLVFICGLLCVV